VYALACHALEMGVFLRDIVPVLEGHLYISFLTEEMSKNDTASMQEQLLEALNPLAFSPTKTVEGWELRFQLGNTQTTGDFNITDRYLVDFAD
jgi:hypothetical protein